MKKHPWIQRNSLSKWGVESIQAAAYNGAGAVVLKEIRNRKRTGEWTVKNTA